MPLAPRATLRRASAWIVVATACLAATATAAIVATEPGAAEAAPAASVARAVKPAPAPAPATGDAKTACIYSHNSMREMRAIGRRIGVPFRCASIYNNVATWEDWTDPWFLDHPDPDYGWAAWVRADPQARRMVIGQSMIPTQGMPADWRRRGASGAYDRHIRALGRNLVRAGLGRSVIRLGYEANGDWNADHVGRTDADFAHWRAYWARFARVLTSVPGARFTLDWNLNSAYRDIPLEKIYPGDRVVDVIGIDVYDSAGPPLPAPGPARWNAIISQPGGLSEILAFARRHGKPISLPEWGLISARHKGGGDNPVFVAAIAALVRNNRVAYQSYFNNDQLVGCLEIQKNRRGLSTYARHFGRAAASDAARGLPSARRS